MNNLEKFLKQNNLIISNKLKKKLVNKYDSEFDEVEQNNLIDDFNINIEKNTKQKIISFFSKLLSIILLTIFVNSGIIFIMYTLPIFIVGLQNDDFVTSLSTIFVLTTIGLPIVVTMYIIAYVLTLKVTTFNILYYYSNLFKITVATIIACLAIYVVNLMILPNFLVGFVPISIILNFIWIFLVIFGEYDRKYKQISKVKD